MRGVLMTVVLALALVAPAAAREYSFGVVPQQAASTLARNWGPLLAHLGERAGLVLRFETAPDIPTFERRLRDGQYDFGQRHRRTNFGRQQRGLPDEHDHGEHGVRYPRRFRKQ